MKLSRLLTVTTAFCHDFNHGKLVFEIYCCILSMTTYLQEFSFLSLWTSLYPTTHCIKFLGMLPSTIEINTHVYVRDFVVPKDLYYYKQTWIKCNYLKTTKISYIPFRTKTWGYYSISKGIIVKEAFVNVIVI